MQKPTSPSQGHTGYVVSRVVVELPSLGEGSWPLDVFGYIDRARFRSDQIFTRFDGRALGLARAASGTIGRPVGRATAAER